jgi:hypothetical protein
VIEFEPIKDPRRTRIPCRLCGYPAETRCKRCSTDFCQLHGRHLCTADLDRLQERFEERARPEISALSISPQIVCSSVDLGSGGVLVVAYRPGGVLVSAAGLAIARDIALADAAERLELSRAAAVARVDVVAHVAGTVGELLRELPVAADAVAARGIGAGVDVVTVSAPMGSEGVDQLLDALCKLWPSLDGSPGRGSCPFCPRPGHSDREADQ